MNSALKAAVLTLIIVAIGFGLMSFLRDDGGDPSDRGAGNGAGNSSVTEEIRTNNRLPDREVLKSSISGIVRDDAGTPLPGTKVTVHRLEGGSGISSASLVAEKSVANDGSFRFDDLIAGRYRFQGSLTGYQSHRAEVTVIDGVSSTEVVLILTSGMTISGTILDPLGKPVADAQIAAFQERVEQEAPLQKRLQVLLELQEMQRKFERFDELGRELQMAAGRALSRLL